MANPSYKIELLLFLMYPGGNITLKKQVILPFVPFKKLWIELCVDEKDESSCVFVKYVQYNTVLNSITVFLDDVAYNNKSNAEKGSLYYINTLSFIRTK